MIWLIRIHLSLNLLLVGTIFKSFTPWTQEANLNVYKMFGSYFFCQRKYLI